MAVEFSFVVGVSETHTVTVRLAGAKQRITLHVDGMLALDSGGNLGIVMPNVFDIEVGVNERHMVSVRFIARQLIDGGGSHIDVFLDGRFWFRRPWH